jgi:hypothetical protein
VAGACRDPQPPPGGRRYLHWQLVSARHRYALKA